MEAANHVTVEPNCVRPLCFLYPCPLEELFAQRRKRRGGFLISNSYLSLGERGSMRCLHLFRDSLVRLLRALADRLTTPGELVPPILALELLVDCHYLPPFFASAFCFFPLPLGLPPSLPHS